VTARYKGRLHVSLRSNEPGADAGRLLKKLLGGGNRGGGHAMIAGGHVELGGEDRCVDHTRRCIAGEATVEPRGRRVAACRAPVVPAAGIDEELWGSGSHRRSSLGPISRKCNGSRVDILLKRRGR